MVKLKLLGVGKSESRCYFIFPKKQNFFKVCRQLLVDLGVDRFHVERFARPTDRDSEPIFDLEHKIKDYTDKHYSFHDSKGEYIIEIIFGQDKVFLIICTKKDKQKEISKIIDKFVED